jgi:hypothetical protein
MLEWIATVIITASSALLFAYWFRYTCLLILNAKTTQDFAGAVVAANQLSFQTVQSELQTGGADLSRLHESLNRDYALLTYLIGHAAGAQGEIALEDRILQLNYRLMGAWCRMIRPISATAARNALEEMSQVVAHFANVMGERSMAGAAA